jgi:polysaccharide biosynthesis/export protein
MHRSWQMMMAVFGCLLLGACASSNPAPLVLQSPVKNSELSTGEISGEYRMGPGDLLKIDVFQAEKFSRTVRVSMRGDISLPLIGSVHAAGLTSQELEDLLARRLKERYLQDPQVSVFIEEFTSQRVTIEGLVKKPGVYPLMGGNASLLQTIAIAGGPEEIAATNKVQLFRANAGGTKEIYFFDIDAIRTGQAVDPSVKGDDIIIVHKDGAKAFTKGFVDTLKGFINFGAYLPLY